MGLKRSDVFPSRYLGKEDVTKPLRSTISEVRKETIQGDRGDEDKPVMVFDNPDMKPMIINSTNWEVIEAAYGPDTDGWIGKLVEVYVDPGVMYGGRRVGGVRVRIPAGAPVVGNGRGMAQPPAVLTWDQALALAATVGMDKGALIDALKAHGKNEYRPSRDTAAVTEIVAARQSEQNAAEAEFEAPAEEAPADDAIPF